MVAHIINLTITESLILTYENREGDGDGGEHTHTYTCMHIYLVPANIAQ
jgi:hypothetical protein